MPSEPTPPLQRGFWRSTEVVHWFVVVGVLMALTSLPTAVLVPFLSGDLSNAPLIALAMIPMGPTIGAAVFAWSKYLEERDDRPARHFLRGYRLNVVDSLKVWVPVLALLTVIAVNVANAGTLPLGGAFVTGGVVIAAVTALWTAHALVVSSLFSFRVRDVARLAVYFLFTSWRATLNAASVVIVLVGAVVLVSDWVVLLLAAPLTYFLVLGARPMTEQVRARFVADPDAEPGAPGPQPEDLRPEG